jgi:peptide deformylase
METAFDGHGGMPDGENLAMKAVKPTGIEPPGDHRVGQPQVAELSAADHTVLSRRQLVQPFCVKSCSTVGHNATQFGHSPRVGRQMLRECDPGAHSLPVFGLGTARTRLEYVSDEATPSPVEELDDELATEATEPEGVDQEALERRSAALSQVVKFGEPVLRSAASPVTEFDDELGAEADRMIGLMHDAIGVGLAATQLGTLRRMLVFQVGSEAEPTVLVNPEIEWRSEDLATAEEGCLSLPGVIVDVERPLHVRARGLDVRGGSLSLEASGLEARVIQHEVDHLDGVLMIDRTEREQRKGALKALREGGTFAPESDEEAESEDGERSSDA